MGRLRKPVEKRDLFAQTNPASTTLGAGEGKLIHKK